jgi:hypothetical protein
VVPKFEELSVKNLYSDALNDPDVGPYIPDLEMNSNRLPERDFFFGVLSTIKPDYLKQIIDDAHKNRYESGTQDQEKNYIMVKDEWFDELTKHPFLSSKMMLLTFIEKPGKAIFLLKERTKLVRARREVKRFDLSKRLSDDQVFDADMNENYLMPQKRKKLIDTRSSIGQLSDVTNTTQHFKI